MYKRISVSATSGLIQEKNPLIFDVRDSASYEAAHVPNAVYLSDRTLKTTIKRGARGRPILLYCYHGNASQDIAKLFCDFGFSEVYSVDGGFESWRREMPDAVRVPAKPEIDLGPVLLAWLVEQQFDPGHLEARVQGATALIKACQLGRADLAADLIQAGARLDAVDGYGNDALWAACYGGDLATVEVLAKVGVALDRQNPDGTTSLMYAASAGKTPIVKFLLQAGADCELENQDGFTALDLASNLEIVKLLKRRR